MNKKKIALSAFLAGHSIKDEEFEKFIKNISPTLEDDIKVREAVQEVTDTLKEINP